MASAGRKPKPAALRVIEGTKASCPPPASKNPVEAPAAVDLTPPDFLNKYGLEMWHKEIDNLEEIGVLGNMDVQAFAVLCQAYGEWRETDAAVQAIKKADPSPYGYLLPSDGGGYKSNPIFAVHHSNKMALLRLFQEYGMTPSSRVRVISLKENNGKKTKKQDYFD